ncbi:hypothetical protein JCGZ_14309 [Jatropha curcas]|uniref:C2 domain-containing protein n=1 Tax=Jatropha curcas TaxID=180498 RepID=A0A067K0E2_JATCU|nr:BON1-associated protein 2 [Jatropha curcas]KDP28538.1 hypothetical protein JCGZ_14309 [Jatropha curcas]
MEEMKILEINLISAQGLKPPSANIRRMQTYAVVWIDSSTKLRTRVDRVGSGDPIWNDKFLFKVSPEFLAGETSGVCVEIYAVGYLRDALLGTVRLLISNIPLFLPNERMRTPSFIALQIRRPSGRFQGLLNIGAVISDGSDFASFNGVSAISYRDLVGENNRRRRRCDLKKSTSTVEDGHGENFCGDSGDISDGADSTTSSSSAASTALKDWNGVRDSVHLRSSSDGGGLFCGLLLHRRLPICFSAQNLQVYGESEKEN